MGFISRFSQRGYILPATILLGLSIAIMSSTFTQFTATTSHTLSTQNYQTLAEEAARAGISYVNSCVKAGEVGWTELRPDTDCSGGTSGSVQYISENTEWRSTFTVATPTYNGGLLTAISIGKVELLKNGTVVETIRASQKTTLPSTVTTSPIATGLPITEIRNDETDCAIANGQLYCWGQNNNGQIGDNSTTDRSNPTLVQGALAGKTVTHVSVAQTSVCAIADGTPYCWGNDSFGQLGGADVNIPTANTPLTSSGPLSGKIVTDISTASFNNPANLIWPFAAAFPHTTALTADGSVSSWGDGGFRQNTGGGMIQVCVFICIPTGYYNYPSPTTPTLITSYSGSGGELSGKKTERVGSSSHDGCAYSEGKLICWGVQAPIALWCNSVLFSQGSGGYNIPTIIIFNPCVGSFSNGYDTHAIWGSALSGKFIDKSVWNLSSNETCAMANKNLVCFGTAPAFGLFWVPGAWGAPWTALTNVDVTDADNGDNANSMGVSGIFCIVDRGNGKCAGQPLNPYTGTGLSGYAWFNPLIKTGGLSGKVATKIAAGTQHGCVVANGQLFCWGEGHNGVLADGNTGYHYKSTTALSGTGGSTPIGTTDGTYAADGAISVGGDHSCGNVNGQLYCWGRNTDGQLGTNDNSEKFTPTAVTDLIGKVVTKVAAGGNHTCAITEGQLYCWGLNTSGELGIASGTSSFNIPKYVSTFSSMRVTAVSAGYNSTCAIANAQLYCWGNNSRKQLGVGDWTNRNVPTLVTGAIAGKAVTAVSVGTTHTCAIANADMYCWGNNANGRTGLGTTSGDSNPTLLTGGKAGSPTGPNGTRPSASYVSAGEDFTCGVFNGTVSCWGNNANGRTGRATTSGNQTTPASIAGAAGGYYSTGLATGSSHACAILNGNNSYTNGNLYCWGNAVNGQVGNGVGSGDYSTPVLINGGDSATRSEYTIDAGTSSTCSVARGNILCWGYGGFGKLGDGSSSNNTLPAVTSDYKTLTPFLTGPLF